MRRDAIAGWGKEPGGCRAGLAVGTSEACHGLDKNSIYFMDQYTLWIAVIHPLTLSPVLAGSGDKRVRR